MQSFIVLARCGDGRESGLELDLVPQGWSRLALVLPPVFLLMHRLWWELAAYAAFILLVVLPMVVANPVIASLLGLAPPFFLFLEGNMLRIAKWERRGFQAVGIVPGVTLDEAQHIAAQRFAHFSGRPNSPLSTTDKTTLLLVENVGLGLFGLEGR